MVDNLLPWNSRRSGQSALTYGLSWDKRLSARLVIKTFQGKKPSDNLEYVKSLLGSYSLDDEMAYNIWRKLFLDSLDYQAKLILKIDLQTDKNDLLKFSSTPKCYQ